ncbi:hypothetical protein APX70_200589 [Pseudomonas syringae pv. maculicola]|uniref:Uncharacterized protein n=1 Tax=Pseudomonas syringae pv. maculicola TaxID=59511 RepID=A0A3M2ZNN1_PSEYM|nr:hypothetical protein APX70_200589 [Pseudomonas syringae pv. maculicola]
MKRRGGMSLFWVERKITRPLMTKKISTPTAPLDTKSSPIGPPALKSKKICMK